MTVHHCCEEMQRHCAGGQVAILYIERFREYGIKMLDGGSSFQEIRFCPWCGAQLPGSLRDEWFERVEKLGKEPDDVLPEELRSEAWWRSEGL